MVLSVQQIVDCSMKYPYDNDGCEGGEIGKSLMYITNYGLGWYTFLMRIILIVYYLLFKYQETEEAYPYKTRVIFIY